MTKLVGRKELEEIKRGMEIEGNVTPILTRLVNTIEVLSDALKNTQNGKVKVLADRDGAKKALRIAVALINDLRIDMKSDSPAAMAIDQKMDAIEKLSPDPFYFAKVGSDV